MSACAAPPNRPPRDVIDRLIDTIAGAKTCMLIAAATAPKTPAREREMEKLLRSATEDTRVDQEGS